MEYVVALVLLGALYALVSIWSLVRENQDCEKANRNYIRALEDGVDELHAERKRLEEELSAAVHQNMALEHYAFPGPEFRFDEPQVHGPVIHITPGKVEEFWTSLKCVGPVTTNCPSCGSNDRAGKCFVPTGIGSGHVLCQSPWHSLVS